MDTFDTHCFIFGQKITISTNRKRSLPMRIGSVLLIGNYIFSANGSVFYQYENLN